VLLPDTSSSARYVSFDAPYLAKAFEAAGLAESVQSGADSVLVDAHGAVFA